LGGFVTASQPVIDTLINRARPMIYSTAVPPAQAAALGAAIGVVREEPERRQRLAVIGRAVRDGLIESGWEGLDQRVVTPILPLIVGGVDEALALQAKLERSGILAVAIRPPTVPLGRARVRLSLRADLTDGHIDQILTTIGRTP
ncbi:MAG: aminotransferase class I/II-fold pyridoxal phosphate-dependent enzyme, partial [Planctomycetota bacterium]